MDQYLGVSYKLSKSENFDEYMKAVGVALVTRKVGNTVSPTVKLTEKDGVYTLHTISTFKNHQVSFEPNQELEHETIDGRRVTSLFSLDGNKVTETETGNVQSVITREFSKNVMKAIFVTGDVICTRLYQRVDS